MYIYIYICVEFGTKVIHTQKGIRKRKKKKCELCYLCRRLECQTSHHVSSNSIWYVIGCAQYRNTWIMCIFYLYYDNQMLCWREIKIFVFEIQRNKDDCKPLTQYSSAVYYVLFSIYKYTMTNHCGRVPFSIICLTVKIKNSKIFCLFGKCCCEAGLYCTHDIILLHFHIKFQLPIQSLISNFNSHRFVT